MLNSDIIEACETYAIEIKIGKEWKHEVFLMGCSSKHINFVIDGKEYVLVLHEVKDGHHFSEYLKEG